MFLFLYQTVALSEVSGVSAWKRSTRRAFAAGVHLKEKKKKDKT